MWETLVKVDKDARTSFFIDSEDTFIQAGELLIDGRRIKTAPAGQKPAQTIMLREGLHRLKFSASVTYSISLSLQWQRQGEDLEPIPAESYLYPR
jgi:hypothetical protein